MQRIRQLIERTVSGLGYETVDVEFAAAGLVRVYIDHCAEGDQLPAPVQVGDCEKVSHQLTHVMEVEEADYSRLEVSSPGTDRPLKTAQHFRRFAGEQITVKLREAFQGQRNFQGELTIEDDGQFGLEMPDKSSKKSSAAKRAKISAAARQASTDAGSTPAEQNTGRKLVFSIDEVDRARLVPTYDFRRHG